MGARIPIGIACVALLACGGGAPVRCPEPTTVVRAPERRPAPAPSPPRGSVLVRPLTVQPMQDGFLLLLADDAGSRVLPVVIGLAEAQVIDLRLRGERFERPLTHDLLDAIVARLGGEIVYVHVDKLRGGIFVGSVYVWNGREILRIDSRTSDAVAIALGNGAPIYVARSVLDEAAQPLPPHDVGEPL